jgi:glycosyltransferase involved in cell wall biosynthesis
MTTPLISVVLDTYNQEEFIEDAIESVLQQDFPREDMEVLVVDDGSTDRTADVAAKFEPAVRVLRKQNGGQASAIDFGISHASGEFVAFLDGDDVWMPDKVSRVVVEFQREPRAVLVYHKFWFWDPNSDRVWDPEWQLIPGDILADRRKLLHYWGAPTSSLTFRRSVLNQIGLTPEECSFAHDTYKLAAALCLGPVAVVPEFLTKNRVHRGNLWFVDGERLDRETVRRRVEVGRAALRAARDWVRVNAPQDAKPRIGIFLRKWRVRMDQDHFRVEWPGRVRYFFHRCEFNQTYAPAMARGEYAYVWAHAFFELIVGRERGHYLEAVRTRMRRVLSVFRRKGRSVEQGV